MAISKKKETEYLERLKKAKDLKDLKQTFLDIIAEMIADWIKDNFDELIGGENAVSK